MGLLNGYFCFFYPPVRCRGGKITNKRFLTICCSSKFALALQAHGATTAKYLIYILYHIQERKAKSQTHLKFKNNTNYRIYLYDHF